MPDQQSAAIEGAPAAETTGTTEQPISMEKLWADATKEFEDICGRSLLRGDVKGFENVQKIIEDSGKTFHGNTEQEGKWDKAKNVGLESLKYLKLLVGAATKVSSFLPIPEAVPNLAGSALCFVFDIPEAIKGYEDAIDEVFKVVSSALAQFRIFTSMEHVDDALIRQIHRVMASFVKLCAHVVKYRQGRRRNRLLQKVKSVFDDDSGLGAEVTEFQKALQQLGDVQGTLTLAMVVETRHDLAILLEKDIVFAKTMDEIKVIATEMKEIVTETHKGVQAFTANDDRTKALTTIRETLDIYLNVHLDTKTTQTCVNIFNKCLKDTGSWIWSHEAYTAWTAPHSKDKGVDPASHVLIISGPAFSGKTSASALITKRLEEEKGRTFVAHYFFGTTAKKSDEVKRSDEVAFALKYMAFQIARVDAIVQKALKKACDAAEPGFYRQLATLDLLWENLKVGATGSGSTYYLVFDGLENLQDSKQVEMLLKFVFRSKLSDDLAGRVRILLSGTDRPFAGLDMSVNLVEGKHPLRILMEENNEQDMRLVVEDALAKGCMLQNPKPDSAQYKARNDILIKLPKSVKGSYSRLQYGLDEVIQSLGMRTALSELDRILDQSVSSHETAIKNLQRSLTGDKIREINELLKWVMFSKHPMTVPELEAAMFLYYGTESLIPLKYIIETKYSAIFKLEDDVVSGNDGVKEYLENNKPVSGNAGGTGGENPTINMTISIHNVDQEICGHFLWDLAHKAIRDKFKFDFDNALHSSGQAIITVDEFEAHQTIVTRAFGYLLNEEPNEQTQKIGQYMICWLPTYLGRLRELDENENSDLALTPSKQSEIGQNLYRLFKDGQVILRHKSIFEAFIWNIDEMEVLQEWLMQCSIKGKAERMWQREVRQAITPTRGVLKEIVKVIVTGFLRERSWEVNIAYFWIDCFIKLEDEKLKQTPHTPTGNDNDTHADDESPESSLHSEEGEGMVGILHGWERISSWCQQVLGLPDSDLDSLWYERLAEISTRPWSRDSSPEVIVSLYQRALAKERPSWRCHRGLSEAYARQMRYQEATEEAKLALKEAGLDDASPKADENDISSLQLLLANQVYRTGDVQKAAEMYLEASKCKDTHLASEGQLGYLKARLQFPDIEDTRLYLKSTLADDNVGMTIVRLLITVAGDSEHDVLMSKLFMIAKGDPELLSGVVRTMEVATSKAVPGKDGDIEMAGDQTLAMDAIRGVLLLDRGIAAYTYKMPPKGADAVSVALRLWTECYEVLSAVGGGNVSCARRDAIVSLGKHYFQVMMDGGNLDHVNDLRKLAEIDSDYYRGDARGFLGALYAFRRQNENARKALKPRMEQALLILSDETPDNDAFGFSVIKKTLEQYLDFRNAAIALSLVGQPDLVAAALYFTLDEMPAFEGVSATDLLKKVRELAKEAIELTRTQYPDFAHQSERIRTAEKHFKYLDSSAPKQVARGLEADRNNDKVNQEPEEQGEDGQASASVPDAEIVAHAVDVIRRGIDTLCQTHLPNINRSELQRAWSCDGLTTDGKSCKNVADFQNEFYQCVYCSNKDFCRTCLQRLRDSSKPDVADILKCSPKHRWLRMPRQGDPFFLGFRSERVRVNVSLRASEEDKNILEIFQDEDDEEISVEEWKKQLATEWDVPVEDIMKDMPRTSTPDGEQDTTRGMDGGVDNGGGDVHNNGGGQNDTNGDHVNSGN